MYIANLTDIENTELADKFVADVIPSHAVVLHQLRVLTDMTQISSDNVLTLSTFF